MKHSRQSSLADKLPRMLQRPIVWLTLFVVLALSYSWMSPEISAPNERSRVYLTLSVLESGDIAVDDQVEAYGKPFDIAERDGHFYSDKAPGSSIIAVPFFAVYQALGGSPSIEKMVNFARTFIMVPLAVVSFLLLRALLIGLGVPPPRATAIGVAFAVGTSFLHYGAAFFGHAMVTCASLLAAFAIFKSLEVEEPRRKIAWQVLVGFAGGLAFSIEYQAALICFGIAFAYLSVRANWRISQIIPPLLGAGVPIGLTLLYNHIAFGSPLETSYAHLHHGYSQAMHSEGLFGVTFPSVEALYGLLFSPSRGLLLCAPIVFLGWFGLPSLWKRCRWMAVYAGTAMLGYLFIVAGTEIWYGGWGFGPRLLVPIFGLAAVAGAALLEQVRDSKPLIAGLSGVLVAGMAYNILVTTTFPELPPKFTAPLASIAIPILELGRPSPNLGMTLLDLEGVASLVPLFVSVGILAVYVIVSLVPKPAWSPKRLAACGLAIFLFAAFSFGYPESAPTNKTKKFADDMSSLRTHPK